MDVQDISIIDYFPGAPHLAAEFSRRHSPAAAENPGKVKLITEAGGERHFRNRGTGIISPHFFRDFQTGIQQQTFETGLVVIAQEL